MEMEKKEYIAPELTVVEMERQAVLQDASVCGEGGECPFGLAPTSNDHLA